MNPWMDIDLGSGWRNRNGTPALHDGNPTSPAPPPFYKVSPELKMLQSPRSLFPSPPHHLWRNHLPLIILTIILVVI